MRRFVALLSSLALIFNCGIVLSEDINPPVLPCESAKLIVDIGVGGQGFIETPDQIVTRAQAAVVLAHLKDSNPVGTIEYADVKRDNEFFNQISFLAALGIIGPIDGENFKPDEPIKPLDAAVGLLKILGYTVTLDSQETTALVSVGFVSALGAKLYGTEMTFNDFSKLVFTALNAEIFEQITFGENVEYRNTRGVTLLNKRFDIYKIRGVVTDNGITALSSDSSIPSNRIKVNDVVCGIINRNFSELLGRHITSYAKKAEDDQWMIYTVEVDRNAEVVLKSGDGISFDGLTYAVDGGVSRRHTLSNHYNLIYNGVFTENFDKEHLIPQNGTVTLVDEDGDRLFDTVIVINYINAVVEGVDTSNNIINIKTNGIFKKNLPAVKSDGSVRAIDLSETERIDIYDGNNRLLQLADIKVNDIVSVIIPDDSSKYIKIIHSAHSVSGKLDETAQESIVIDGEEYPLTDDVVLKNIVIGGYVIAHMDFNQQVAFLCADGNDGYKVGYFRDMHSGNQLSTSLQIKLFDETGKIRVYDCDKNVEINTVRANSNAQKQADILRVAIDNSVVKDDTGAVVTGALLQYRLNKDGLINSIKTVSELEQGGLVRQLGYTDTIGQRYMYKSVAGAFGIDSGNGGGAKTILEAEAICFWVPLPSSEEATEDSSYILTSRDGLGSDNVFTGGIETYSLNGSDSLRAKVLVIYGDTPPSRADSINPSLITNITEALDQDGESTMKIYTIDNNIKSSYYLPKDKMIKSGEKLEPGDVVRFTMDRSNKVADYDVMFRYATKKASATVQYTNGANRAAYGSVIDKDSSVFSMYETLDGSLKDSPYVFTDLSFYEYNRFNLYKVSRNNDKVVISGAIGDEIKDYAHSGEDCSKVLVLSKKAAFQNIIIYE